MPGRDYAVDGVAGHVVELRLAYREPMDAVRTLRWLGAHAVAGVETLAETPAGPVFTRTLRLTHGPGRAAVSPGGAGWVRARLVLSDPCDRDDAVVRLRRLLDLDADPLAVDAVLGADPALAALVRARPGLRAPGSVDGPETALRTVVGQQVSLASARAVLARIVATHGEPVYPDAPGRLFPAAPVLAEVDPGSLPLPGARARAVVALASAIAAGRVVLDADAGTDADARRAAARRELLAIKGVGPWTVEYVVMRALGDPDVLLATDLAARRVAHRLGIDLQASPASARAVGTPWAPWRSYATHHLWAVVLDELAAATAARAVRTGLASTGKEAPRALHAAGLADR